jgi:hypothetical protein
VASITSLVYFVYLVCLVHLVNLSTKQTKRTKQTNNDLHIQERGFTMWLRLIVTLAGLFISTPSFATGTDQHVLGTIMAINGTHVEVKTPKGQSVDVRVNKMTRYKDESNPRGANVPEVGDRVIIKATRGEKKGDNVLLATEIHFSAAKRLPAPMEPVSVQ